MAHPHDLSCRWCGFGPLYTSENGMIKSSHHACTGKPPLTPEDGAAAAFGLMGMALAIKETYLCSNCGSWEGNLVTRRYCQCENDD